MDSENNFVSQPKAAHLLFYHLRPYASVVGVSTFMHLVTAMLAFSGRLRWLVAVCIPTAVALGYHLWWLDYVAKNNNYYPAFFSLTDVLILDLALFSVGFYVVSVTMHFFFGETFASD